MKQLSLSAKHRLGAYFFLENKVKTSTSKTMIQKVKNPSYTLNKSKIFINTNKKKTLFF